MALALTFLALNPLAVHGAGAKSGPKLRELALELGAPFRDHAILQRGMKVPVWGWSQPGTELTVAFAGQSITAKANELGKWMAWLDSLEASFEPREMVISEKGGKSETLVNILVGEVWMASGQSNMQWTGTKSAGGKLITQKRNGVAPIREMRVQGLTSQLHPIERAEGAWRNGGTVNYSAIAYAFANKLYRELDVPVGILNCSFSQTPIQAWIPRQGYASAKDEYSQKIHKKCLETVPGTPEHKAAWDAFYASLENQIKVNEDRIKKGEQAREIDESLPGNLNGNRDANWLFNGMLNPVIPYAIRGAIWNQGYANMGEGLPYYNNLHSLIRGWRSVWNKPELPVYFHQFYGIKGNPKPSMDSAREMRLGTWLARDIPNAGMASQIDIGGGIHYYNKVVPGQRLALHALKNQYPSTKLKAGGLAKDLVAEGPMYKSYRVEGNRVVVEFENAKGGLVAGDTSFNRSKAEGATGFANPKAVSGGEEKVKLFYVAGEDKVWHPATIKIDGESIVVTSSDVKNPRGVSYGMAGDTHVNLYNQAMLPMTPFTYYNQELVTSKTWPEEKLKIAGEVIDPNSIGLSYEWRKMPILPPQFRDNAVLQAGQPITFWGSTQKDGEWGEPAEGKKVIHFKFGKISKEIAIADDQAEWSYTVPAMEATTKPLTLDVSFTIDGELAHQRVCEGMLVGDVIYVAAPSKPQGLDVKVKKGEKKPEPYTGSLVRMLVNGSKRPGNSSPSRYSVCVSRTPKNRFASFWRDATGLAAEIGEAVHAKTGHAVGIVFMNSSKSLGKGKGFANVPLKNWMGPSYLKEAPSLMEDYKAVGSQYPDNPYYVKNIHRYISDWKGFWADYMPSMVANKALPEGAKWGASWGSYPNPKSEAAGDSSATHAYNISVHPFSPMAVSAAVFLTTDSVVVNDQGENFGPEMSALGNSFKGRFGGEDFPFIYGVPSQELAPKLSAAKSIKGQSQAVKMADWNDTKGLIEAIVSAVTKP
jgi:hypothetical protein